MGHNLKLLGEEQVDQTLYYEHSCTLELRECIHDHFEDMRPVYTKEEFIAMSDHWIAARKKYDEMGQPNPEEQNATLDTFRLQGKRLHHERAALEYTRGGADKDGGGNTFHFHYRHVRTHLSKRDFNILCDLWKQSDKAYAQDFAEIINLNSDHVKLGQVAADQYIPWLQEYIENQEITRANPDDFWDMYLESKKLIRPEEEQRPDGGWLRDEEGNEIKSRTPSDTCIGVRRDTCSGDKLKCTPCRRDLKRFVPLLRIIMSIVRCFVRWQKNVSMSLSLELCLGGRLFLFWLLCRTL